MIDVNEFWDHQDLLRLHINTEVGKIKPFGCIWQCLVIEDEPGYRCTVSPTRGLDVKVSNLSRHLETMIFVLYLEYQRG